jgi:hypothetical protein
MYVPEPEQRADDPIKSSRDTKFLYCDVQYLSFIFIYNFIAANATLAGALSFIQEWERGMEELGEGGRSRIITRM